VWSDAAVKRLRVVLADDHESVRDGLRVLFETRAGVDVVTGVSDGPAAIAAASALAPDVVVLDLSMPCMSGLEAARQIKATAPGVAVVVLTRHSEHAYVQEVFATGADGYVLKQSPFDELLKAVKAAAMGHRYLDRNATQVPGSHPAGASRESKPGVTEREMSVLRLAAIGHGNKDIAAVLNIAVKTVEVHKSSAMRKLQLRDRAEMLRYAVVKGWLQDV
jgi:DNA-binding NarL/FixJ family response regulator